MCVFLQLAMKYQTEILSALSEFSLTYYKLLNIIRSYNNSTEDSCMSLCHLAKAIGMIQKEELAKMPTHINVISISAIGKLKETAHSAILQSILKKQEILDSFITEIAELNDVKVSATNVRDTETDRIDVSIYDTNICVIVENKVNKAPEQKGQIYRYVKCAMRFGYTPSQIKVVYLNPDHHYPPSDFSLSENGESKSFIPEEVKNNIIVKNYSSDIYNWIKKLPAILPDTESYLHSALSQYQDYLEEYFYLTDKYIHMKERIKKIINSEILSDMNDDNDPEYTKRINKLDDATEDINQLLSGIINLKHDMEIARDRIYVLAELNDSSLNLVDMRLYGYSEDNFGIHITINGKPGFVAYGYGNKPYIGFGIDCSLLTRAEIRFLNKIMKDFYKYPEEEPFWAAWDYIGNESLQIEFARFVNFVDKHSNSHDNCNIQICRQ